MMKIYNRLLLLLLLLVTSVLTACEDRLELNVAEITEGMGSVRVEASFRKFAPALSSRTAGDAIQEIQSLTVFVYDTDGKPVVAKLKAEDEPSFPLKLGVDNFVTHTNAPDASSDDRVEFDMILPNGKYRMYALANMDIQPVIDKLDEGAVLTEEKLLKSTTPKWDADNIEKNNQMFGRFASNIVSDPDASAGEGSDNEEGLKLAPTVVVNGRTDLHVWLRRCASKITFQYDGTQLYDGVYIYLMSATVKDIPVNCALGVDNKVTYKEALIEQGEIIDYYDDPNPPTSSDFAQPNKGIVITNDNTTISKKNVIWPSNEAAHTNTADALFFFENNQGFHENIDKAQRFKEGSTTELEYIFKDDVKFGTYIEVEAIYLAKGVKLPTGEDYNSTGVIKYRFMLGKDKIHDFNAERNHHYKLTLKFKGKGNDVDWHIEYAEQVLDVTQPKIFDYQGRVFMADGSVANLDHNFSPNNRVMLTSYMTDNMGQIKDYDVYYKEDGETDYKTTEPSWLSVAVSDAANPYDKYYTFTVKEESIVCDKFGIDELFNAQKGTEATPYNLANPGETVSPKDAKIINTANCYMIDAPGYYLLPLVYGNAIVNGQKNESAYKPGVTGENLLGEFLDYKGKHIQSPYIKDSGTPKNGMLVWEDEHELIDYTVWNDGGSDWNKEGSTNIKFIKEAYGGMGGLQFYVPAAKEGNAIIAVTDQVVLHQSSCYGPDLLEGYVYLPEAMWSWHIWVTSFAKKDNSGKITKGIKEEDHTIRVLGNDPALIYDLMPVNLGWCSEGEPITYYPGRKCLVKFKSGDKEKEITIEQKSHIALPRGNNTYYQWGRKDPFIGAAARSTGDHEDSRDAYNKPLYIGAAAYNACVNPPRFTKDIVSDANTETVDGLAKKRKTTVEVLPQMIQWPYKFHNPPRTGLDPGPFASNDKTYFNLWDGANGVERAEAPLKTIYDPCPVGYQVPNYRAFSGFTVEGVDASDRNRWFDMLDDERGCDIKDYDSESKKWQELASDHPYRDQVYQFYTTHDKYQSIVFPQSGYRDWDAFAYLYKVGRGTKGQSIGYIWSAHIFNNDHNYAYNFEFTRYDETTFTGRDKSYVRPQNPYFPCDAFPVRACRQPKTRIQNGEY